jgi:hypothetical protein
VVIVTCSRYFSIAKKSVFKVQWAWYLKDSWDRMVAAKGKTHCECRADKMAMNYVRA